MEPDDNGGGCGRDMKPEHGSSKRKKELKEKMERKSVKN